MKIAKFRRTAVQRWYSYTEKPFHYLPIWVRLGAKWGNQQKKPVSRVIEERPLIQWKATPLPRTPQKRRLAPVRPICRPQNSPPPRTSPKRKPATPQQFEKTVLALYHLADNDNASNIVLDIVDPPVVEVDFDALQEADERLRPERERAVAELENFGPTPMDIEWGPLLEVKEPLQTELALPVAPSPPCLEMDGLPPAGWFYPFPRPEVCFPPFSTDLPLPKWDFAPRVDFPFAFLLPRLGEAAPLQPQPEQQPVGTAPLPSQQEQQVTVDDSVPQKYQGLNAEAEAFFAKKMGRFPQYWYDARDKNNKKDDTEKVTVSSFTHYPSYPHNVNVKSPFHCPDPSNPEEEHPQSRPLGAKRMKEERERFSKVQKEEPEVWENILGVMLQEGVTIDNLLLCHDNKAEVLENQKWEVDYFRFDNLAAQAMMSQPLEPGTSKEFHKAPADKARLFNETLLYLKNHGELCYLFRIIVSVWLKNPENQEKFRRIARKAGWIPWKEREEKHKFIFELFDDADNEAAPKEVLTLIKSYMAIRYPRFFHATVEEEELDWP